ncbi:MAG: hypothetical protein ABID04_01370 [Patescibacteria group bacterium]
MKKTKDLSCFKDVLWSRKLDSLDTEKDKVYIVHQVLSYGSLSQIKKLIDLYSLKKTAQVFNLFPKKNYTPSAFNFISQFILNPYAKGADSKNYVKTIF